MVENTAARSVVAYLARTLGEFFFENNFGQVCLYCLKQTRNLVTKLSAKSLKFLPSDVRLWQKCPKFVFGWGSPRTHPHWGAS